MEENVKINKEKNFIIIILVLLVIFIIGAGIYFIFIKKDDNSPEVNKPVQTVVDNKENNKIEEQTYKTKDGKITLRIVDINDKKAHDDLYNKYRKLMAEFENELGVRSSDDFTSSAISGADNYAYFNDIVMTASVINEDEHYINYHLKGVEGEYYQGHTLIVNKDTKTIEINPDELTNLDSSCTSKDRVHELCGLADGQSTYSFIKTEIGYFYFEGLNHVLYTTSWKKLGHVRLKETHDDTIVLEEIDSKGITAYEKIEKSECSGDSYIENCKVEYLNPTKYDINGNIIK